MEPQQQENFFELTLSQEGSARILRLFRLVKWVFLLSIICSLLLACNAAFRFFTIDRYSSITDWQFRAETIATPIYLLVVMVLFLLQIYFYFHFTRLGKKAIELRQADLFNYSFKWLIRHAIVSLVILSFEIIMIIFSLYVGFHLVQKYPSP